MSLYGLSIEGEMEIFSEHDENTLEELKIELRQFMEGALQEFLTNEHRLERFRASGNIGRIGLTKE